ncbi:hypothetical protein [Halovibrio salipaludis]|uniref:hypothetical protein n=1 Tax=Halovibrio salipaludis TaxID=2032626 RepID=UPI0013044755|nr:hypothetical protein [Halovibrio salipaludis]
MFRQRRPQRKWALEEIEQRAAEERARYSETTEDEPDALASGGDMEDISGEEDDETE